MAGIFINYRRDDVPGVAGRLFDHLVGRFPRRSIFMDVDAMKPGMDFVKQLDTQVSQCDVLLAVIGPHWYDAKDQDGHRRLDSDTDYVRIELASALKRDIPVIPLLVDGAVMPAAGGLPDDLKSLTRRHALELRHTRFDADALAVMRALEELVPTRRIPWRAGAAVVIVVAAVVATVVAVVTLGPNPLDKFRVRGNPPAAPTPASPTPSAPTVEQPISQATAPAAASPTPSSPPKPSSAPTVEQPISQATAPTAGKPSVTPSAPANRPTVAPGDRPNGQVPNIPSFTATLRVDLGDGVDKVRTAYNIRAELPATGDGQLNAGLDGLMFFFKNNVVSEIRADAPFAGNIEGVHIGETLDEVVAKLGQPLRSAWSFGFNKAYLFGVAGQRHLRCDIDKSGKVATIFYLPN